MLLIVTRPEGCTTRLKPKTLITFWTLIILMLLFGVSCQEEEAIPVEASEKIKEYFPLRYGNQWTYTVEGIRDDGQISSISKENWKVNYDLYIDLFELTPNGENHLGYRMLFLRDDLEINDIMGTFISLKYLNLPVDSLVLIASDSVNFLRERWIKGGLVKMKTTFGELDCICTKTTYHFTGDLQDEYQYFCKNIGIYLIEKNYLYEDEAGYSKVSFTWRRTLTDYKIK